MIGASKLTEKDVREIKKLLKETDLRCGEIAKMFGVSRVHISQIKHGRKWNKDNHSFLMKQDIKGYTRTITLLNNHRYSSGISPIYTLNGEKYVILHYIDDVEYIVDNKIYETIPDYEKLRERHTLFVELFVHR